MLPQANSQTHLMIYMLKNLAEGKIDRRTAIKNTHESMARGIDSIRLDIMLYRCGHELVFFSQFPVFFHSFINVERDTFLSFLANCIIWNEKYEQVNDNIETSFSLHGLLSVDIAILLPYTSILSEISLFFIKQVNIEPNHKKQQFLLLKNDHMIYVMSVCTINGASSLHCLKYPLFEQKSIDSSLHIYVLCIIWL